MTGTERIMSPELCAIPMEQQQGLRNVKCEHNLYSLHLNFKSTIPWIFKAGGLACNLTIKNTKEGTLTLLPIFFNRALHEHSHVSR
jgi:hypothetical protein